MSIACIIVAAPPRSPSRPSPDTIRYRRDSVSADRGALGSESGDSGVRAARPVARLRVDAGPESAFLHAPKTGGCRPDLHTYHSHIEFM